MSVNMCVCASTFGKSGGAGACRRRASVLGRGEEVVEDVAHRDDPDRLCSTMRETLCSTTRERLCSTMKESLFFQCNMHQGVQRVDGDASLQPKAKSC
eukprot:2892984-Pleurochrysis_carterae.AAC.1